LRRGRGVRLAEIEGVLDLLSKIFKNYVADESGNDGNHEIGYRENILNRE
jgi:hypothetical protein